VKAIDFRVLIRNQWVIVCSLVGLVALCTTIVDVVTGKFGSSTTTPTQNTTNQAQNQVTPQQQQPEQSIVKPKHARQWVIDSSGGKDSDAKDFFQVVNSLQDGDTIQVKAGSYNGPIALAKSVSITGETDPKTGARPSIHYSGGTGCAVTSGQVIFETLDFSETTEGSSVLITARLQTVVQIKSCNFVSRGSDCVAMLESAQLVLEDCSFRTLGKGYGCYIKGNAKATINRCTFEENRGCVDCIESGSALINDSKFVNNTNDSKDSYTVWLESTGTAELNRCTFTENTIPIIAARGAMALNNCRLEKIRDGFYHFVLAAVGANTSVTLTGCEFVANQHAVVANQGARLSIEGCKFQQSGQVPTGSLAANDANVLVAQPNSQATITNTTFSDVQFAGVLVADQAQATLKDTTIQGGQYGVDLGVTEPNLPKGGFAQLENVTLKGQIGQAVRITHASNAKLFNCHIDGDAWDSSIYVNGGSGLEMAGCEVKGGQGNGLEVITQTSQAHAEQCQFLNFQGSGVLARDKAKIVLSGCTLEQNDTGAQAGGAEETGEGGTITLENCTIRSNRTYGVSAFHRGSVGLTATNFSDQPNQTFKDPSSTVRVH
jgi:hypothetical protein